MTEQELDDVLERMDKEFMKPDIQLGDWLEVETTYGTEFLPADLVDISSLGTEELTLADKEELLDYTEAYKVEQIYSATSRIAAYGARLSAPGYLDCTGWSVFSTLLEAKRYLVEQYGDE